MAGHPRRLHAGQRHAPDARWKRGRTRQPHPSDQRRPPLRPDLPLQLEHQADHGAARQRHPAPPARAGDVEMGRPGPGERRPGRRCTAGDLPHTAGIRGDRAVSAPCRHSADPHREDRRQRPGTASPRQPPPFRDPRPGHGARGGRPDRHAPAVRPGRRRAESQHAELDRRADAVLAVPGGNPGGLSGRPRRREPEGGLRTRQGLRRVRREPAPGAGRIARFLGADAGPVPARDHLRVRPAQHPQGPVGQLDGVRLHSRRTDGDVHRHRQRGPAAAAARRQRRMRLPDGLSRCDRRAGGPAPPRGGGRQLQGHGHPRPDSHEWLPR